MIRCSIINDSDRRMIFIHKNENRYYNRSRSLIDNQISTTLYKHYNAQKKTNETRENEIELVYKKKVKGSKVIGVKVGTIMMDLLNDNIEFSEEIIKLKDKNRIKEFILRLFVFDTKEETLDNKYRRLWLEYSDILSIEYMVKTYYMESGLKDREILEIQEIEFSSVLDFIVFDVREVIRREYGISKCKNCGSYFLRLSEDEVYCSNIAPQSKKLSCKKFNDPNYDEKKHNAARKLEYGIYNKIQSLYKDKGKSLDLYNEKIEEYKSKRRLNIFRMRNGELTIDEFIEWLRDYYKSI